MHHLLRTFHFSCPPLALALGLPVQLHRGVFVLLLLNLSQTALFCLLLLLHSDGEGICHAAVRDTHLLRWVPMVRAKGVEARQGFIGFFVRAAAEYYVLVVQLRYGSENQLIKNT